MTSFGVTLLSGGLDSTTVTAYARDRVDRLTALTFHYGQTHSKEVDCAAQVAELLGLERKLIDISFLGDVAWYSALTHPERFPLPRGRAPARIGSGVPITYVPLRNTIFLALSAGFLESQVLHAIEVESLEPEAVEAYLFMAPNAVFFAQAQGTLELGSKLSTQYGVGIRVETPIIELSKAEIARLGVRLKAPLEHTWSCYEGGEVPCGACDSCLLRAKGFAEAGIADPLLVRLGRK